MGDSDSQVRLRFPTLELYSALHGGALALGGRHLTTDERKDAEFIFQSSIDLDKVRVVNAIVANAPTTLGNFIRIGLDGKITRQTMIHELAHIWQYQTMGTAYISNSLCSQLGAIITEGDRNAAYNVTMDELKKAGSIYKLSAEKQAVVVESYYADPGIRNEPIIKKFIEQVRSAKPLPEKIILEEAAFGPGMGRADKFQDLGKPWENSPGTYQFRLEF